jgi:hypothetical protein
VPDASVESLGSVVLAGAVSALVMEHLGRFRLGDTVTVRFELDTEPDHAPSLVVRDENNNTAFAGHIPRTVDRKTFEIDLYLGPSFEAGGRYRAYVAVATNGSTVAIERSFDVVPGGDRSGSVISLAGYERPHADFVVAQVRGLILVGKNPRV